MRTDTEELALVFKILQENATLVEASHFLKLRGLPSSAVSWEQLTKMRIEKALDEKKLSRSDLIELIRLTEEHGKQHIFLYRTGSGRARSLMERGRVGKILEQMGIASLLRRPRILDKPASQSVADVRWEIEKDEHKFILKTVEKRVHRTFVDERSEEAFVVRRYKDTPVRAVNLFKLHQDGLLELRIYSHVNSSEYRGDVTRMWTIASQLFPLRYFSELLLTKAKINLWKKRKKLARILRYSGARFRNPKTVLSAATGTEQASLIDDEGTTKSLDEYLRHNALCDASNIWWLSGKAAIPSKHIHVLLSGLPNEFTVTGKCSQEDYNYVLTQLRRNNR